MIEKIIFPSEKGQGWSMSWSHISLTGLLYVLIWYLDFWTSRFPRIKLAQIELSTL